MINARGQSLSRTWAWTLDEGKIVSQLVIFILILSHNLLFKYMYKYLYLNILDCIFLLTGTISPWLNSIHNYRKAGNKPRKYRASFLWCFFSSIFYKCVSCNWIIWKMKEDVVHFKVFSVKMCFLAYSYMYIVELVHRISCTSESYMI